MDHPQNPTTYLGPAASNENHSEYLLVLELEEQSDGEMRKVVHLHHTWKRERFVFFGVGGE